MEAKLQRKIELLVQEVEAQTNELVVVNKTSKHNEAMLKAEIEDLQGKLAMQVEINKELMCREALTDKEYQLTKNQYNEIKIQYNNLHIEYCKLKDKYKVAVEKLQEVNNQLQELKQDVHSTLHKELQNSHLLLSKAKKKAQKELKTKETAEQDLTQVYKQLKFWQQHFKDPYEPLDKLSKLRSKVKMLKDSISNFKTVIREKDIQISKINQQKQAAKSHTVSLIEFINTWMSTLKKPPQQIKLTKKAWRS